MKRKSNQRLHQRKRSASMSKETANTDFKSNATNHAFQSNENPRPTPPPLPCYRYGFTNSEFFAYIASLSAYELVTLETIISILLQCNLNTIETKLLANIFIEIGITIGNIVEQEILQESLIEEQRALQEAYLNEQLGRTNIQLDQRVKELEQVIYQMQKQLEHIQSAQEQGQTE